MSTQTPSFIAATRGLWTLTWRSKLTWKRLIPVLASMVSIPIFAASVINPGQVEGFHRIVIDLYFFVVVPIFCLINFGSMIRDELQDDTITFLITRPVSRAKVYLLKYITLSLWLQIILFGNALGFWVVGLYLEIPSITSLTSLIIVTQALAVFAIGALSSLLGMFTQKYIIAGVAYGFIVEFGIGQIPTNINVLSISRHLKTLLARNTELMSMYDWPSTGGTFSLGMIFGATALFLTAGALLFNYREYHHTEDMQKS